MLAKGTMRYFEQIRLLSRPINNPAHRAVERRSRVLEMKSRIKSTNHRPPSAFVSLGQGGYIFRRKKSSTHSLFLADSNDCVRNLRIFQVKEEKGRKFFGGNPSPAHKWEHLLPFPFFSDSPGGGHKEIQFSFQVGGGGWKSGPSLLHFDRQVR